MANGSDCIKSFDEFWPYYLNEHSKKSTRRIHVAGTATGLALLGAGVLTGQLWLPLAGLAAGYGSAWTAHVLIEKNKPATFKYPLWSLRGDFRMLGHFLTGTLEKEAEKHVRKQYAPPQSAAAPGKSLIQRVRGLKASFRKALSSRKTQQTYMPQQKPPQP